MNDSSGFGKLVPGFDFLQNLAKNAGAALPGIGQWVAPTLDPAEIEKRIEELKTVQFWLEQNVRMIGATIQALEVQRMTLSTLKTMNVQMGDLRESLRVKAPGERAADKKAPKGASAGTPAMPGMPGTPGAVDPLQWWGALTQQFTQLAASAMKDGAADAARTIAGSALKKSFEGAAGALRQAAATPGRVASAAAGAAGQALAPSKPPRRRAAKR